MPVSLVDRDAHLGAARRVHGARGGAPRTALHSQRRGNPVSVAGDGPR